MELPKGVKLNIIGHRRSAYGYRGIADSGVAWALQIYGFTA
jgi:hypothetical protein